MDTNIIETNSIVNNNNMDATAAAHKNIENNSNNEEQQEPQIKLERFEAWELPLHVDLISDDGNDDGVAGVAGNEQAPSAIAGRHTTTNQANVMDKRRTMNRADLMALQQKLADKYRTMPVKTTQKHPSPEPEPEAEPESESEDERDKFEQAKKIYERRKKAGKISVEEEIVFMHMEGKEMERRRKADADTAYLRTPSPDDDDEDGLFVRQVPRLTELRSEDEAATTKKRKRGLGNENGGPAKKRGRPKKTANHDDSDDDDNIDQSRQKPGLKSKTKPQAKVKGKSANGKRGKHSGPMMTNINSLYSNDVFEDAAATANLAAQPSFTERAPRTKAFKELLANIPDEDMSIARAEKKVLDQAIKDFDGGGHAVKPAEGDCWTIVGMRTPLKHFQILGVSWMRKRERSGVEPKGGILADQMGLGKTLMMLGNIMNGRPKDKSPRKTTLIVATRSLLNQWNDEIRSHCESRTDNKKYGIGDIHEWRSGSRLSSSNPMAVLESAEIVLTTYHDVMKSYPKADVPTHLTKPEDQQKWWEDFYEKHRGVLHRIEFHRIVLDEGHHIKNPNTHVSRACRTLIGKHRWVLSGTPIHNGLKEWYPYFKFLRFPNCGDFQIFKLNFITSNDPTGMERLSVILRRIMLRRTHGDRLFNARLLELPTPTERTQWLEFSSIERQVYEIVKHRFINRINSIAKQGGLEKSYSHIFTMLLRLRQICAHILLIQGPICDLLEREDFERLNHIAQNEEADTEEGENLLLHLRNVLSSNVGMKTVENDIGFVIENESSAEDIVNSGDAQDQVGGRFGLSFKFTKYLDCLKQSKHWTAMQERTLCCICQGSPYEPYITSCYHIYCRECLQDLQHQAARRGYDYCRCASCDAEFTYSQPCDGLEEFEHDNSSSSDSQPDGKKKKGKKVKQGDDWISLKGDILPSAKTRATKAALMNIFEEEPDAKVIVFTQWLPMARILGRMCQQESREAEKKGKPKWDYLTYNGEMSHDARARALDEFATDSEKRILVASLKCGGIGLNMTMASRVILLDPWWNRAIEQQAFGRVYRIGQVKETTFIRFVVKNSIDAALMSIKERKQLEIDEIMDSAKLKEKLSVKELMSLFGEVGEDEEGRAFIFADEDENEHLRIMREE